MMAEPGSGHCKTEVLELSSSGTKTFCILPRGSAGPSEALRLSDLSRRSGAVAINNKDFDYRDVTIHSHFKVSR